MKIKALLCLSIFILSACTASKQPRKDGFLGGLSGIATGKYESDLSSKEKALADRKHFLEEANADNEKLASKLKELEKQENKYKTQVAKNKKIIAELEHSIQNYKKKASLLKQKTESNNSQTVKKETDKQLNALHEKIKREEEKLKIQIRLKQKLVTPEE